MTAPHPQKARQITELIFQLFTFVTCARTADYIFVCVQAIKWENLINREM